jgi:tRNA dimethylallyltransferase
MMRKIIIIVGPTAVGKTDLSLALAEKLQTEIISADSVQIYKNLDIGSAKPTLEEMRGIPHHLIDFVAATEAFSVSDYVALAKAEIGKLFDQGKMPIVVGGTGLYVNSLMYDMNFGASCADETFRMQMEDLAKTEGNIAVHELLNRVDPVAAARIHPNNLKRVIRALEVNHITGRPFADFASEPALTKDYEVVLIGLTRPRDLLYDRINKRVGLMLEAGLVEEVKKLKNSGLDDSFQSMQGIGYKEVLSYLDGRISYDEMVDRVRQGSRNYAKRQITWFKRYEGIHFIDLEEVSTEEALREILSIIHGNCIITK